MHKLKHGTVTLAHEESGAGDATRMLCVHGCGCAQTAMIENGFVHVPERAPWLAPYLAELTAFPNGKHDDQVDSTAQMLDWFKQASRPRAGRLLPIL
jgi:phage terminase large subunit-like protein